MKILQVIPFFSPKFGGTVTVLSQLSKELAYRGHDVTILTSDYDFDEGFAKGIEDHGVKVIPLRTQFNFGLFIYTPAIKQWLNENGDNFDLIHMHNYRAYQNNCVFKHAVNNNIPYVLQAHGSVLPVIHKERIKKIYDHVWGYRILTNASKMIAVSDAEYQQYVHMGISEEKIAVMPNGIDIAEFKMLPKRGSFRIRWGIAPGKKVVLYLGRLHRRKGIDFLIRGFSRVSVPGYESRLVIVGSDDGIGDELAELVHELGIKDRVIFTGLLSAEERIEALVDADVLVYPGILEIFGLVPLEAIMCGTPVIVCDDCGCGEIIKKARCGLLVQYGNIDDLTAKIEILLNNPDTAASMVKEGKAYIMDNLQYQRIAGAVEELYEDCIRHV